MQTHKPVIFIVGPSGSGKSSSLEKLDPKSTLIIDPERKGFPFRVGKEWEGSIISAKSYVEVRTALLQGIKDAPTKGTKVIVIDSFTAFCDLAYAHCDSSFTGYEIFKNFNSIVSSLLTLAKNLNVIVIFTALDEILKLQVTESSEKIVRRVKVTGKVLEGAVEQHALAVLFTNTKTNGTVTTFKFATGTDGMTSAKAPKYWGLAPQEDNDIAMILEKIKRAEEGGV